MLKAMLGATTLIAGMAQAQDAQPNGSPFGNPLGTTLSNPVATSPAPIRPATPKHIRIAPDGKTSEAPATTAQMQALPVQATGTPRRIKISSAEELIAAYRANETAARAAYNGNSVIITANITKREFGLLGNPILTLKGAGTDEMTAYVNKTDAASATAHELDKIAVLHCTTLMYATQKVIAIGCVL